MTSRSNDNSSVDCSLTLLIKETKLTGLVHCPSTSAIRKFSSVACDLVRTWRWLRFSRGPAKVSSPWSTRSCVHKGMCESCVSVKRTPWTPPAGNKGFLRCTRVADVELSEGSECQLDIEHGRRRWGFQNKRRVNAHSPRVWAQVPLFFCTMICGKFVLSLRHSFPGVLKVILWSLKEVFCCCCFVFFKCLFFFFKSTLPINVSP